MRTRMYIYMSVFGSFSFGNFHFCFRFETLDTERERERESLALVVCEICNNNVVMKAI